MNIQTTCYNIINSRIPKELSGYRMALLSDLHNGEFGEKDTELVSIVRDEAPDVILVPGDAVNKNSGDRSPKGGYSHVIPLFARLSKIAPILYANGNHEARLARRNKGAGHYLAFQKILKKLGVTILNNRSLTVRNGKLRFVGLDLPLEFYQNRHERVDAAMLAGLLGEPEAGTYTILLAHTPEFFRAYLDWGADLVVSGHVHGGMVRLPIYGGLLSPHRRLFPGFDYGSYREDGKEMIVSAGLSAQSFPPRILNPLEVVMLTLYHSAEDVPDATEC